MRQKTAKPNPTVKRICRRVAALVLLCGLTCSPERLTAEDSDLMRPYFHLRRGEFNYAWGGAQDMWGLGLGLNLNRYLGVELAFDIWEKPLHDPVLGNATLGEESTMSLMPQLRLRYPLFQNRFVPYVVGGFGASFYQFNDPKSAGFGRDVDGSGTGWAASAGAGFDYFIADNIALNLEVKYVWHSALEVEVDDHSFDYEASSWIATVGFRIFLQENKPRPLAHILERPPTRVFLGFHAGLSVITDGDWNDGVKWRPEASAWGGTFLQQFGGRLGVDFGRHWGVELVAEGGQPNARVDGVGTICDYSLATFIPAGRLRLPIAGSRWQPYLMAGAGLSYGEANDFKPSSEKVEFKSRGLFFPAFTAGGGVEYFIARNLSLSAESRWTYAGGLEYTLDGQTARGDFSQVQFMLALRLYLLDL